MTQWLKRFRNAIGRMFRKRIPLKFPPARGLVPAFAILGMLFLSCLAGAAMMHFDFGLASFFRNSFEGFQAWKEHGKPAPFAASNGPRQSGITKDVPGKAFDGYTLYTTTLATEARLIDMRGEVVHSWQLPFSKVWPHPTHVQFPVPDDQVHWFRCRLFPNGDLLAIYQTDLDTPHGYGLAKLDKNSRLIWAYSGNVHHDLDVDEDGTIYALVHQVQRDRPAKLDSIPAPYLADYLVVLSADGEQIDKIPLIETIRDSRYSLLLASINNSLSRNPPPGHFPTGPVVAISAGPKLPAPSKDARIQPPTKVKEQGDVLHANSVRVLTRAMAGKFPLFKAGQVLISLRSTDTLMILDVPTRSIVWAAQGLWRGQHDPEFLENGHLLIYDNSGLIREARVLEYDPRYQDYPWSYSHENSAPILAHARGMKQHLPNGNVLIIDPEGARILEISHNKELVWEFGCPEQLGTQPEEIKPHPILTGAWRYPTGDLKFLDRNRSPRP